MSVQDSLLNINDALIMQVVIFTGLRLDEDCGLVKCVERYAERQSYLPAKPGAVCTPTSIQNWGLVWGTCKTDISRVVH